MVVFLVSAQERRIGSWWTLCAWKTVSSLSIGTTFRTKPREPPRKAGFRCSETSSLTNEQTAPEPVHEKKRIPPCSSSRRRMGFCRHVLAPLLRSLSPHPAGDSGNSPVTARLQGHVRSALRSVRFSWASTVWRQFGDVRGSSLNSREISILAVAHGNRI